MKRMKLLLAVTAAAAGVSFSVSALAVDAVAARKMARRENCLRCHTVNRKKEGPSYQSVAYKYKGDPDAVEKLTHHLTSGEKVKLSDGHYEMHEIVKTKDPAQIRNLIEWILSQ